jgi:hypothetical protein
MHEYSLVQAMFEQIGVAIDMQRAVAVHRSGCAWAPAPASTRYCFEPPTRSTASGRRARRRRSGAARGRVTPWTLFLLFSADPCVAVIPLMFAAAPLGWGSTLAVIVAYEAATIVPMVLLAVPARAAAATIRGAWAERYGDALAGGGVALVGLAVLNLGI